MCIHLISIAVSPSPDPIFLLLIIDVFAVNISWSADGKLIPVRDMEVVGEGGREGLSGEGKGE